MNLIINGKTLRLPETGSYEMESGDTIEINKEIFEGLIDSPLLLEVDFFDIDCTYLFFWQISCNEQFLDQLEIEVPLNCTSLLYYSDSNIASIIISTSSKLVVM